MGGRLYALNVWVGTGICLVGSWLVLRILDMAMKESGLKEEIVTVYPLSPSHLYEGWRRTAR